jgi:hypothetical protein
MYDRMIYDYPKKVFNVKQLVVSENRVFKKYRVEFESFIKTPYPEVNRVVGYFYEPEDKITNRVLLFLHGIGNRNLSPLTWFPRNFAENGISLYLLILPYHFEKTPNGMISGKKYLIDDMDDTVKDFQQAVIDLRTSMGYLDQIKKVIPIFQLWDSVLAE